MGIWGNKGILEHLRPFLSGGWIRMGPLFRIKQKQKFKNVKTSLKAKQKSIRLFLRLGIMWFSNSWHYWGWKGTESRVWEASSGLRYSGKAKGREKNPLFAWYDLKWGKIPESAYRYFYKIDLLFKSEGCRKKNRNLSDCLICFSWMPFQNPPMIWKDNPSYYCKVVLKMQPPTNDAFFLLMWSWQVFKSQHLHQTLANTQLVLSLRSSDLWHSLLCFQKKTSLRESQRK